MPALVECNRLHHSYGGRQVINDLSFRIPKGGIYGLLGKNGAGKTTTINILSGYLRPRAGERHLPG